MSRHLRSIKHFFRPKDKTHQEHLHTQESLKRDCRACRSIMSAGVFIDPICSPYNTPPPTSTGFIDYYAVLGLDRWATTEEIKNAQRKLRAQYFQADPKRYKALQTAYAVLVSCEARRDYDVVYRLHYGLPTEPRTEARQQTRPTSPLEQSLETFEQSSQTCEQSLGTRPAMDSPVAAPPSSPFVEDVDDEHQAQLELADVRAQDPNWALKHYRPIYSSVLGTYPYTSFVPLLHAYEGRSKHPKLRCARPKYTGVAARFSSP